MQRPPELVPIPEYLQKASESSGKLLHFGEIPKKFGQNLGKNKKNSGKICEPEHPLARSDILHCLIKSERKFYAPLFLSLIDTVNACIGVGGGRHVILTYCLRTCHTPWHSARNRALITCENLSVRSAPQCHLFSSKFIHFQIRSAPQFHLFSSRIVHFQISV